MSIAEPTNEAHNLNSMPEDVLRAILARARFDDQAALKRVCKRFLAVITSRAFREERRASGCLEHTVLVMKYETFWWTTLVAMKTFQYSIPIFAFDGEGAVARFSFGGLPCDGPGGMVWAVATLG